MCGTSKQTQACRATLFVWVGFSFAHDLHKFSVILYLVVCREQYFTINSLHVAITELFHSTLSDSHVE